MLLIILIIILLWKIYTLQYYDIDAITADFEDIKFKTGDLVLFKPYDNHYALVFGCYFTHVGIVVVDNNVPMIFEANRNPIFPYIAEHTNGKGIHYSCLKNRIAHYAGKVYLKKINKEFDEFKRKMLMEYIDFAMKNMYYSNNVISNAALSLFGLRKCRKDTDCGQILFLLFIKLGLISFHNYYINKASYLYLLTKIKKLDDGYFYACGLKKINIRNFETF
jgi:hypothetical protein